MKLSNTPGFVIHILLAIGILALIFCDSQSSGSGKSVAGPCPSDMIWVEAGRFCIDRYEFPNRKGVEPVRGVDYLEALKLCRSRGRRLPTRVEFELACGGKTKDLYPYGPGFIPDRCRAGLSWPDGPAPSGSYPGCENGGVYDMTGNVWEWVQGGNYHFIAGGAWNSGPDRANCRDHVRLDRTIMSPSVGLRCILSLRK